MLETDDHKGLTKLKAETLKNLKSFTLRLWVFVGTFGVAMSAGLALFVPAYHWHNVGAKLVAMLLVGMGGGDKTINYHTPEGGTVGFVARTHLAQPALSESVENLLQVLLVAGSLSLVLATLLTWLVVRYLKGYQSEKKSRQTHLRGASFAEPDVLAKRIRSSGEAGRFQVGQLPIPASVEDRHFYFSGDTGNGKSQAMMQILDVIRAVGEKLIILDKNGEMTSRYYDPERDYILGPFDARSHNWSVFSEGRQEVDFEQMARSFVPRPVDGKESHWAESSVNVLTVLLDQLGQSGQTQEAVSAILTKLIESEKVVEKNLLGRDEIVVKRGIFELVKGTIAQLSLDPDAPEHASSVLSSLIPHIRSLTYLRGLENQPLFSIKDWVKNPADKGWVFIRVSEQHFELVEPLVRTWLDTAIKAVLSLKKPAEYDVFFCVDELQSMGPINSLKKGLHEGRGHGLRCILGFTSVNELFQTYGEHTATGMLSQCNTKVAFAVSEPKAAAWNADLLGSEEVIRENESLHYGDRNNLGVADHQHESKVIMPAQIQNLPRFTAFVKFSGDWPVTRIHTEFKARPEVAPYSVERVLPPMFRVVDNKTQPHKDTNNKRVAVEQEFRDDEPLI